VSDGRARSSRLGMAIVVTFAAAFAARGAGPVETDGATALLPGDAPRRGIELVDPGAQTAPPPLLPAIAPPAPLGDPPAAPTIDVGPGGNDLGLAGAITMPGGEYDVGNLYVDKNAYVTFTGPTTIRAAGWAALWGRVLTTADDAPLTIVSAGSMRIGSYPRSYGSIGGVSTEGLRSDVTLECSAAIALSYGMPPYYKFPRIYAAQSSVRVRAGALGLGPQGLSAGLDVDVLTVGDITSSGLPYGDSVEGTWVVAGVVVRAAGNMALRSAAGSVTFYAGETACGGRLTIEAGGGIALDTANTRLSADGGLDLVAHGGAIQVTNAASIVAGAPDAPGTSSLRARDGVSVTGAWASPITGGSKRLVIESTAGDVVVGEDGASVGHDVYPSGILEVRTPGAIRVRDGARLRGAAGATLEAGGELSAGAGAALEGGDGALVAESGVSVNLAAGARAIGASVTLRAPGALSISAGARVESTVGDVALTGAPTTLAGADVTSQGSVRAASLSGTADVRGAALSSRDVPASFASGSVQVVAFGAAATILAQGATLRSGAAAAVSGDVILRVVADPAPGAPAAFDAPPDVPRIDPPYLVPSTVTLKPSRDSSVQDLELRGFVDMGLAGPIVPGNAVVTIGDASLAAALSVARRGTGVARGTDVVVVLGPARRGSGRRPITLRTRGAFLPADRTGELAIRVGVPGVAAACRVRLDAGRFDAGHGGLVAPALFVAALRAVRGGVRLTLGVPAEDLAASGAPDVELQLADGVRHVESADFRPARGGRLVATAPAAGLARMTVDPSARTIAADVPRSALGVPAAGGALDVALRIDGRGVGVFRIVVGRPRARIVY
jgi:hypothetical protein